MLAQWGAPDQLERYDLNKWASSELHPSVVPELVTSEPNCPADGPVSLQAAPGMLHEVMAGKQHTCTGYVSVVAQ